MKLYCIKRQDGKYYAGGFGSNLGAKFTDYAPHAELGDRNQTIKMLNLLKAVGFSVKIER